MFSAGKQRSCVDMRDHAKLTKPIRTQPSCQRSTGARFARWLACSQFVAFNDGMAATLLGHVAVFIVILRRLQATEDARI
ncbi:hypothetical protein-transmembrane prediction [Rhodopirellula baltica SH 1]|uniref:Uncharacterized protein n=1 Tax=Rhodopirellula baltica (strain DSM 10527 / NCIMB 13988 / SH1) TaxID=243090 RepID=Q7UYF2_RHOBA|nr:hypothetical protein-transmembrane prediction [Rhodopirellula baltica SH 1]